jgi:type II secretory pathway pseudopilin PulG
MTLRSPSTRRTGRPDREDGFALITTVLTIALLAAFSLVALQQVITDTQSSRKDQDWVAALGAAQAGIDDYVSRLNESNGEYFKWRKGAADPSNPAMGFSGTTPTWAPVPTASGAAPRAFFHYDVDNSGYTGTDPSGALVTPNGNLVVTSTGRVGSRTRTLQASVRRSGFVDFVYFTDFETQDPLDYPVTATAPALNRAQALAGCVDYWGLRQAACTNIQFAGDTVTGPVHSNDTMLVCENNAFKDVVTTMAGPVAANGDRNYRTSPCAGGTSGTSFARGGDPKQIKKVNLPSTNLGLKFETSAGASPRGCLYVGPTKIVIKGGQIRVTSPWTKNPTPGCLKDTYFTIPVNGVIYVDVVPAENTGQPNSWTTTEAGKPTCPTSDTTPASNRNNVGFPIPNETGWDYPCKAGDVFIEQEGGLAANGLTGRMTVSANNNLYITNHIDYVTVAPNSPFLGLIAEQFVYVWHPVQGASNLNLPGQSTPFTDARISAALLSVNHSFMVQNNSLGLGLGNLNVTGAITQKFRGIIKRGSASYVKNYVYDQRLRYDAPPRFLNPTISSFGAVRTEEQAPAYR